MICFFCTNCLECVQRNCRMRDEYVVEMEKDEFGEWGRDMFFF